MPFQRTSKALSERVAATLPTRDRGLRAPRRLASWSLAALAAGWLLWQQGSGNDRVYHAGSISAAHQFIADDCARCHKAAWQPLRRLVSLDNSATSTPDAACIQCHAGPIHNEHPAATMTRCAHCHREHHGEAALAAIDDRFCTACHADLPESDAAPLHFAGRIASFAEHPEFAIFRADVATADAGSESGHGAHRVAEFDASADPPKWRDRAAIRFNHAKHMRPSDARGTPMPGGGFARLDCDSCHQGDNAGRYMRPIVYEQHCARCHPLKYDAQLQLGDALPHRDVKLVRDTMRGRLADAFRATQPEATPAPTSRAIPGAPPEFREGELAWVNERLAAAEHVVFGQEAKGGCRFCHTLDLRDNALSVVPPAMPDRWQSHARFNHASHRLLDCVACHKHAAGSTATADILLPKIDVCRECHGATASKTGQAGDRCVKCHDYHDHRLDTLVGQLGLDLEPVENSRRRDGSGEEGALP